MEKFVIEGGERLKGVVNISGSKNSALPLMAATIIEEGVYRIENVPHLKDIDTMARLITMLGGRVKREGGATLVIDTTNITSTVAPYELVKEMRASILALGALVGRTGRATVSYPGGCAIGERPINLHLKGLSQLGCEIKIKDGYIDVKTKNLKGTKISFDTATVGGTENILMAAVKARGETIIENAAREPEVVDLVRMLRKMGARIEGEGTEVIKVSGVDGLSPCDFRVIPDRIEAGTFLVASAITRGNIVIRNCIPQHLVPVIDKLKEIGMEIEERDNEIKASMGRRRWSAVDIRTAPYPGFPTDMQAQFMALLSIANGVSAVTETIFENRMTHAAELRRMGADIKVIGNTAIVRGVKMLNGAKVMASDLRASASLVLAGLAAHGRTEVTRIYHIDRGYESIEKKLSSLGARIERRIDEDMDA
ncbi:MAG: UDP-N-acetylglucosamine 1-carboxyvinyltransferase [Syntrophorhabdaceae bacterium]|nr:UDP-N-acetylglucosamine 1-carboxyvinyltransferase [Syntrophorhabdaceae bacterium]